MNQFIAPWRNLWRSLLYFYDDLFLWLGLSAIQGFALITLILAPPVAAGLNVVGNERANGRRVNFDLFREGFRQYFWMSYKYLLIWFIVAVLLVFNVYFYANRLEGWPRLISFMWIYLGLFWFSILPYILPIMLETEQPTVKLVYRNTLLLALSKPIYTLFLLFQLVVLSVLTRYIPILLFLFLPAIAILLGNLGTRYLIDAVVHSDSTDGEN